MLTILGYARDEAMRTGSYGIGAKKTQIETVCDLVPNAIAKGVLPRRNVANRKVLEKDLGLQLI